MRSAWIFILLMSSLAQARGPIPHERTDVPKMRNSTTGRFLYLGDVPKFEGEELEITVSKMNLTARVTAHVSQGLVDTYAHQLFLRWKTIKDATTDPGFSFHPLVRISQLAEGKPRNTEAWAKVVEQYSSHILEETGIDIYKDERNASGLSPDEQERYKETITEAYFRFLFGTSESSDEIIDNNRKLGKLLSKKNSRRLFQKHLGHLFVRSKEREGHVGYLTFVYPIAATVEGPFKKPYEAVTDLKTVQSVEARWWSNKWGDEFGGFPFLLIDWNGIAFHGPISNYNPLDVWYLRRDYVSHGCHRMDGSDLLELRALMPHDPQRSADKIKVTILDYFDVFDWNRDGKPEVMDVKYYKIPTTVAIPSGQSLDEAVAPYLVVNQEREFLSSNPYAAKFYDPEADTLKGIPRYVTDPVLKKTGTYDEVSVHRFDYRPNRIIQYSEAGHGYQGFDDVLGKYPPILFQKY